jgi:hypothetical protein
MVTNSCAAPSRQKKSLSLLLSLALAWEIWEVDWRSE